MKWKIINNEKAQELHIEGLNGVLVINLRYIPQGMSLEEYVKFLEENNIVLKE